MVTTTCLELAGINCTRPISGHTADELKQSVLQHAQTDHPEMLKQMTPQDLQKLNQKIEAIFTKKSLTVAAN